MRTVEAALAGTGADPSWLALEVTESAVLPDDRLPLDTMARDALVLGFPAFPLCRPDCAGLCPVCGADRNTIDCGHGGPEQLDPRWAGLADLRTGVQEEDDASPHA